MPLGKFLSFLTSPANSLSSALAFELTGLASAEEQPSAEGLVPGKDFRIFRMGQNDSEKGTFTLTPERAKMIELSWQKRGVDTMIDAGHSVLEENKGQPVPAMGWCKLQARQDGLYAVDVKWTSAAAPLVKGGQIRYFSPLFEHTKSGEILSLANIAVTGVPASHGISPLSSRPGASAEVFEVETVFSSGETDTLELTAEQYTALSSGEALEALGPLNAKKRNAIPKGEFALPGERAYPIHDINHARNALARSSGKPEEKTVRAAVHKKYPELKKTAEAALATNDVEAPKSPAGKEAPAPGDTAPGADGDPLEPSKPIQGLTALTALAKQAGPAVEGVLMALVDSNKTVTALSAKLAKIEGEKAAADVTATVSAAIKDGKLIPAQKQWATDLGKKDITCLRSYLSVAPKLGPGVGAFTAPTTPEPSAEDLNEDAIKAVAEATGRPVDEVRKTALEGLAADKKRLTALRA